MMPIADTTTRPPICDDALAAELTTVVHEIADELQSYSFVEPTLTGDAGAAVFFSYFARAVERADIEATSERLAESAAEQLAHRTFSEALFGGFTGIAWCLEHLVPSAGDDDPNAELDAALLGALARPQRPWHYDLISGLVGAGVYALERAPRPCALDCLRQVIDRLARLAERTEQGLTWWSDPRFLGNESERYPRGYYNLGLAHGVPGVVALLSGACAVDAVAAQARPLLEGAVAWLLGQARERDGASRFAWITDSPAPSRTGWCYGDPGVAIALLLAARATGNRQWAETAVDVALAAAGRSPAEAQVVDAGLCHGSAGLAHIFGRFHRATGDARFAAACRHWLRYTLQLRRPGQGVAGFSAYGPDAAGQLGWLPEAGLLTGAAGIALALLGVTTHIAPDWDRVLLCSVRPHVGRES